MTKTDKRTLEADYLTPREIQDILNACSKRGHAGSRDKALFAVMWRCGLRVSEALDLLPKDIGESTLMVQHGKGDRSRVVGLDAGTRALVDAWMARRKELKIKRTAPVFCTFSAKHKGGRMDREAVRVSLNRAADRAGIDKRVHPHGLRHAYACELVTEDFNVHEIQRLLGHANLNTTQVYLDRLPVNPTVDKAAARVWGNGDEPAE